MDGTKLDWATAEALALGSLLAQGKNFLSSWWRVLLIMFATCYLSVYLSYNYLPLCSLTREVLKHVNFSFLTI